MAIYGLKEVQYAAETAFAENATSPASNTWATRIPVKSIDSGPPDQQRDNDGSVQSRANESRPGFLGVRKAELEFTADWGGHCTSASGALSATWLEVLMGNALGGSDVSQVGAQISGATNATQFAAAGATLVPGAVC